MLNRNHMEEKASARFISIGQRIKSEIKLNKSPFPLNTRQEGEEGLCNRALLKTNHRLLLSTLVTAPCTFKGTGIYSRESTKINLYLYFFFFHLPLEQHRKIYRGVNEFVPGKVHCQARVCTGAVCVLPGTYTGTVCVLPGTCRGAVCVLPGTCTGAVCVLPGTCTGTVCTHPHAHTHVMPKRLLASHRHTADTHGRTADRS